MARGYFGGMSLLPPLRSALLRPGVASLLHGAFAALLFSSCNVVKLNEHFQVGKLKRQDIEPRSFNTPGGVRFAWYRDTGKPKLLLLHGITGSGMTQWAGNAKELSKHFDLILPDLIGHGKSTWTFSGNSVDAQVAHVALLLDSLGVKEPVHVVGNSYGGAMAANFAEQHPERTRTLVIYDGPASDYGAHMADSVAIAAGAKGILDLLSPTDAEGQRKAVLISVYDDPALPKFILRQVNERYIKPYHDAQTALLSDLLTREAQYVAKVYRWPMPVYVMWGRHDELIPLQVGLGIHRRNNLPADHLVIVEEAGHVANVEQKKEFNKLLVRLLIPQ
jgi:abhydrolase domain-containing protein 6